LDAARVADLRPYFGSVPDPRSRRGRLEASADGVDGVLPDGVSQRRTAGTGEDNAAGTGRLMINGLGHHDDYEARACSAIRPNRSSPTDRTPPELASALHDRWENEIGPVVHGLLIAQDSVVTKVTPTPASPLK
jgi:hypothetical protein